MTEKTKRTLAEVTAYDVAEKLMPNAWPYMTPAEREVQVQRVVPVLAAIVALVNPGVQS